MEVLDYEKQKWLDFIENMKRRTKVKMYSGIPIESVWVELEEFKEAYNRAPTRTDKEIFRRELIIILKELIKRLGV